MQGEDSGHGGETTRTTKQTDQLWDMHKNTSQTKTHKNFGGASVGVCVQQTKENETWKIIPVCVD